MSAIGHLVLGLLWFAAAATVVAGIIHIRSLGE